MTKVFTFGESMGLILGADINEFSTLSEAKISSAGSEGNVAIGLSRLGLECTWYSRLGEDSVGDRVEKDLLSERVNVQVKREQVAKTGLMIKTTPRKGKTSVSYYRAGSAASRISPNDFAELDLSEFNLVHLTGITPALSQSCREASIFIAEKAKQSGCIVSFDVNFRSKLWAEFEAAPVLRRLASKSDILIAGIEEAELLTGGSSKDLRLLANDLLSIGPSTILLKQGSEGATLFQSELSIFEPSIRVEVVDTVGAGDAFSAAFLGTLLLEGDIKAALSKAVVAGGLACTHPGDWQGFPSRSELADRESNEPVNR